MTKRAFSLGALALLTVIALGATVRGQATQPSVVAIDVADVGAPFGGWGTSLAWWAHRVGDWPDDRLDPLIDEIVDPTRGLGLTVFRYNIGGGEAAGHPHHLRPGADVPGFKPTRDGPYDWTADAGQRRVLAKLRDATTRLAATRPVVEAFSNSPPHWLTISGCVAGSADGGPNLRESDEAAFADYLADVCVAFRDRWGITFDSLEPMNEPDAGWWKSSNNQEGMHVGVAQQGRLIRLARAALDARGLRETIVSATDANDLDAGLKSLRAFDDATLAALGRVNVHSYKGRQRDALRELAATLGKPVWQSETGPLSVGGTPYEQAMKVARRLVVDINRLRPDVWCIWQTMDNPTWGPFTDRDGGYRRNRMFDVVAIFARAVRPGDRFVRLDVDDVLASVSADGRRASVFVVNVAKTPSIRTIRLPGAGPATLSLVTERDGLRDAPATVAPADGVYAIDVPAESSARLVVPLRE